TSRIVVGTMDAIAKVTGPKVIWAKVFGPKVLGIVRVHLVRSLSWAGPGRLARRLREMPIHFLTLILMFISQCNTGLA
ncbi:hypothetical protein, partial [Mesorhizobium sp.]|uniref:hypothetical protein n=1 Tax=Mesorhizobium sp. TaxID=1871066 RepID=UPI0025EBDBC4